MLTKTETATLPDALSDALAWWVYDTEDRAVLTRHSVKCPGCGEEKFLFYLEPSSIYECVPCRDRPPTRPAAIIREWPALLAKVREAGINLRNVDALLVRGLFSANGAGAFVGNEVTVEAAGQAWTWEIPA